MTPPASPRPPRRRTPHSSGAATPQGSTNADRGELLDKLSWEARRSAALLGMVNRATASRTGLNPTDVETLALLAVLGTATPTRLAKLLAMGTGSITLVIDRLERAGVVRRVRDTKDRRSLQIELVEDHRHELADLYTPLRQGGIDLAARYSDEQLTVIADYLTHANDMLRDAAASLTGQAPTDLSRAANNESPTTAKKPDSARRLGEQRS